MSETGGKPSLPPGWTAHVSRSTGRNYFFNRYTGAATWELGDLLSCQTGESGSSQHQPEPSIEQLQAVLREQQRKLEEVQQPGRRREARNEESERTISPGRSSLDSVDSGLGLASLPGKIRINSGVEKSLRPLKVEKRYCSKEAQVLEIEATSRSKVKQRKMSIPATDDKFDHGVYRSKHDYNIQEEEEELVYDEDEIESLKKIDSKFSGSDVDPKCVDAVSCLDGSRQVATECPNFSPEPSSEEEG